METKEKRQEILDFILEKERQKQGAKNILLLGVQFFLNDEKISPHISYGKVTRNQVTTYKPSDHTHNRTVQTVKFTII